MAKITIDGQTFEVDDKSTILQAAGANGVAIPHFCYHPTLSIPANCRMCLVEVGTPKMDPATKQPVLDADGKPTIAWMPKLQTSCSSPISDGMVVKTQMSSKLVADAQKGVLEFILINHPLDCPICDQAGECPLQNYTYEYGPGATRFDYDKVHKPKRVVLGPNVVFDAERCINCTRCIRFCDEIAKSPQLTVVNRGDKNYIATFPGEELDNAYSMNVIDLCPVGALTSRDYRFRARVWEMSATPSVCSGCARGCNTNVWVRDNQIMRLTPRQNDQVNGYYMCDAGRLDYNWVNAERVDGAFARGDGGGVLEPVSYETALGIVANRLRGVAADRIAFVSSGHATNESLFAFAKMAGTLGVELLDLVPHERGEDDHLLLRADKTPNRTGAMLMGAGDGSQIGALIERIRSGAVEAVVVLEDDLTVDTGLTEADLARIPFLVVMATNTSATVTAASVVLPAATFAEQTGSFTNFDGVVQKFRPAVMLKGLSRQLNPDLVMSRLDRHATVWDSWQNEDKKTDARPSWQMLADLSVLLGKPFGYNRVKQVMDEIAGSVAAFSGVSYKAIGDIGMKVPLPTTAGTGEPVGA